MVVMALLLVSACGSSSNPPPLTALPPEAPADLCSTIPMALRQGLIATSDSDTTGAPTAACSLRSSPSAARTTRAVVTWLDNDDEATAQQVLDSQCRAIDPAEFTIQKGLTVKGATKVCGGSAKKADASTIAAMAGRQVLTVRVSNDSPGLGPRGGALAQGTRMLEAVIAGLVAPGATASP